MHFSEIIKLQFGKKKHTFLYTVQTRIKRAMLTRFCVVLSNNTKEFNGLTTNTKLAFYEISQ